MQEGDTSSDRRRVQEDEYFRRRDQELLEQQLRRSEAQAERQLIAQAIGLNDDAVVDLQLAGYKSDTVVLLELAPPIQVAWADGSVSTRERELLWKIAAREHVAQGSPAYAQLGMWIDQRPSTDLFEASLRAMSDILNSLQPDARAALRRKLIADCAAIAEASGGFLGWNHVSNDKRRVIERIAGELA